MQKFIDSKGGDFLLETAKAQLCHKSSFFVEELYERQIISSLKNVALLEESEEIDLDKFQEFALNKKITNF